MNLGIFPLFCFLFCSVQESNLAWPAMFQPADPGDLSVRRSEPELCLFVPTLKPSWAHDSFPSFSLSLMCLLQRSCRTGGPCFLSCLAREETQVRESRIYQQESQQEWSPAVHDVTSVPTTRVLLTLSLKPCNRASKEIVESWFLPETA